MSDKLATQTVKLTGMAHGGSAIAKGKRGVTLFVPRGIEGELVKVELTEEKNGYAHTRLLEVIRPSSDRIEPACQHFPICGGCHFQHVEYEAQLGIKTAVVADQLARIGRIKSANVQPTLPHPSPWAYRMEMPLSPAENGRLGFWSPELKAIFPVDMCPITDPALVQLLQDVDMDLPGLRKLTLRRGDDEALLVALEVDDVEPPELEADFPVSVAIVLPDNTAASLVGDHFSVQSTRGHDFRVSPGSRFLASPAGFEQVVETVLKLADLTGQEMVLDLYSGVGRLARFLAPSAAHLVAIEQNPDAVADTAVNLEESDNVSLYEGAVEQVVPQLAGPFDLAVIHPPRKGMSRAAITAVVAQEIPRLITIHSDLANGARDAKLLQQAGYELVLVQPIDVLPQTYEIDCVMLWQKQA